MRTAARIVILIVFFLSGARFCCAAAPLTVKASIDKKIVLIGEKVRYTITVSADKNIDIALPDTVDAFKDISIVDSGRKTRRFFNRAIITQWTIVQTFSPGIYTILGQEIKYKAKQDTDWKSVLTEKQTITVRSLLNKTTILADIKGPMGFGTSIPVIILVILAGLILVLVFRKKIFPEKKKITVEIEPWKAHETAYAQLDALRRKELLAKAMIKQYYSELSDILRHYLENRFSLKAPEMTTEEFIAYVREYSELGREQKDLLKDFLINCDLVKFAKYIPPETEGETAFEMVKKLIDQTKAAGAADSARPVEA